MKKLYVKINMNFLWASPSSQGILELSYFGHGKAFLRSNSISLQLRIRKQRELIRKRREIDFASKWKSNGKGMGYLEIWEQRERDGT